jgi:hypothetical protein
MEGWYLDTGASSHMTGSAKSLSKLNRAVQGTVRFGDGSVVPIEGHGIVTFLGKTREKIKIVHVLYIPRLRNNIISLGQMDEKGCSMQIHRGKNRLYVLQINVVHDVCLGVRHDGGEDEC